ncbi:MFS transporter [Amycolatopsis sp. NPDC059657]|uniref:MFS transporter n=1 Tax=Amycolatopsis sp. NPDC059657 TaxID=3346899 RepID=UPI00366F9C51
MGNPVRTRSMITLFACVALMNTAMTGPTTVATLIVAKANGPGWSGLPSTASVLGTAIGAFASGYVLARKGRRFALSLGYAVGTFGAAVAFGGAVRSSLLMLVGGILLLGIGQGGAQLSRYLAADLYPPERRGFALSTVVWGGTVGALAGPALIAPAAHAAERLGLPPLSGPVVVTVLSAGAACLASMTLPRAAGSPVAPANIEIRAVLRRPVVLRPLLAMIVAQLVMVALMVMTPLQLQDHEHGLDVVSWVLSAHMIGMFALAPLSGRIADRFGGRVAIAAGLGVLALAAATAIAAPTAHTTGLPFALFLLGYGWNLCFVGGSSLLSRDLPADERVRVQGSVDALVWGASAIASLSSAQLYVGGGFVLVSVAGGTLAVLALTLLTCVPALREVERVECG